MPLIITKGLGQIGNGSSQQLLTTSGYGQPGPAAPCTPFNLLSSEVYSDRIELIFDTNVVLSGPALLASGWSISTVSPNIAITVSSVLVSGPRVKLYLTEGTTGGTYTVNFPGVGIKDTSNNVYQGPFTYNFNAVGIPPFIALASPIDAFTIRVQFSEAVVVTEAMNPANYSVTPPLTIFSVVQESPTSFILTSSQQTPGTSYTITASFIRDAQGNLI